MPWKEQTPMSLKIELTKLASHPGANISQLCRHMGISRKTAYKWLKRYQEQGSQGLEETSRRPHTSPYQTDQAIEKQILAIRDKKPTYGARKIRALLLQAKVSMPPSVSTITHILRRHGLLQEQSSHLHQKPWQRFEHEAPNDLWQMDFKGHFQMSKGRCHPLTIIDDHSRFALCLKACEREIHATVKTHLIEVFRKYGLPLRMNMDNGNPWATAHGHLRYTSLTIWLLRLGIRVSFSRIGHPQTNGKNERFHRTLKTELLQFHYFRDLLQAQKQFDRWRDEYNLERPHEALQMQAPVVRYCVSQRSYPEQLPAIIYRESDEVRYVNASGYVSYKGRRFYISEALREQPIAFRETREGRYDIFFCHQKISFVDMAENLD